MNVGRLIINLSYTALCSRILDVFSGSDFIRLMRKFVDSETDIFFHIFLLSHFVIVQPKVTLKKKWNLE